MRRVLPATGVLLVVAQLCAAGGTHLFCHMTHQVVDDCCCDKAERPAAPALADRCCDEVKTAPLQVPAVPRAQALAPTLSAHALPPTPTALTSARPAAGTVRQHATAPPRLTPLYVLERQLLI
jgi:hypothetical protein